MLRPAVRVLPPLRPSTVPRPAPALLLALLVACAPAVRAQEAPRYTFVLSGIPLAEALNTLIDHTAINLIYETDLVAGKTAFCRARRQPVEAVLSCILKGTGLDYYRLSSGTYVVVARPREEARHGLITGQVTDAGTGAPIPDAEVVLLEEHTGTATNGAGRFAFADLRPGRHVLVVTHVAYEDRIDTVWVPPEGRRRVGLALQPRLVLTAPVVVTGFTRRLPSERLGADRQRPAETRLRGTGDVLRDLDPVVGVSLGDALSEVHVQGGSAGEHQYVLDNATVFVPLKNGGFIGPFSPFALRQITVRKAGFGVTHGSELAGVIAVAHEVAPREGPGVLVQADPLNLNARVNGRLGHDTGLHARWMAAGRFGLWNLFESRRLKHVFETWSHPDAFLFETLRTAHGAPSGAEAVPETIHPVAVGFTDLHAALRLDWGGPQSLYASYYRGDNTFGDDLEARRPTAGVGEEDEGAEAEGPERPEVQDRYAWTNTTAQLRYERVLSGRVFATVEGWVSWYELAHPFDRTPFDAVVATTCGDTCLTPREDFNDIVERGVRLRADVAASGRHFVTAGLEAVATESEFQLTLDPFGEGPVFDPSRRQAVRWREAAFVEDRWALSERATLTPGLRLTYLDAHRTVYAEPRLAFRYDAGAWALRTTAGLYRQFLHQFDVTTYNVTALLPSVRYWLPIARNERPPRAVHLTAAALARPADGWQLTLEAYYKRQPHLRVPDYGGRTTAPVDDLLTDADGYAYGAALTVERRTRHTRMVAQYEAAVARRRVANRFGGAYVQTPWNVPSRFFAALDVHPLPGLTATLRWQGVVGRAWGFRQAYYDYLEPDPATRRFGPYDLSDPVAHKLPFFSQVDAGLAYSRAVGPFRTQARFQVLNLLDRHNVRDWGLLLTDGVYRKIPREATPFLPALSFQVQW